MIGNPSLTPNLVFFDETNPSIFKELSGDSNSPLFDGFFKKPIIYYNPTNNNLPFNHNKLNLTCIVVLVVLFGCFCYNSRTVSNNQEQSETRMVIDESPQKEQYMNNINSNNIEYFAQDNNKFDLPHQIEEPVQQYQKEPPNNEMVQQVNDIIKNDRLDQSMEMYPNRQLAEVQYPTANYNNQISQSSTNPLDIIKSNNSNEPIQELTYSQMEALRKEQDSLIKNNLQTGQDPSQIMNQQQYTNKKDLRNDSHSVHNQSDSPIEQIQTEVQNENKFNDVDSYLNADSSVSFSFI